jgi:ADP-heptose:LPS heptosyltransferase/predicted SAM-dependent methyltransferase
MVWKAEDPQGNESGKIMWELVKYTTGRGLDVGCGPYKAFPHFIGVDNYTDTGKFGIKMKPDVVANADDLGWKDEHFDFVFSSHLLEHLEDPKKALAEWWRVIKVGGYLILYLPHKDLYPNVGTEGANPDHKHDFTPIDISDLMIEVAENWDLIRQEERNEGTEYSFFQVYQKRLKKGYSFSYDAPKPEKTAAVVRYGGIGDMIQAASILPELKKQGYHITFYTTDSGKEVIEHDKNIDEFYIQGRNQVPREALTYFWDNEKKKYDKWVNLSESVEGTWLTEEHRSSHAWPLSVRNKYLNANYLEFIHDLAEVPHTFHARFHATPEEKQKAKWEKNKLGKVICWSLSGSAVHKRWPWMDHVIARILLETDYKVVLMGDEVCQLLERGWENEKRVICTSGKWSVRKSLAFAEQADLVIGPETGLLNAVGMLPVPKIVMLSHSSETNLTLHWKNTAALKPANVKCFPCHQLHTTWDHCVKVTEGPGYGSALCQHEISIDQVWDAINQRKAA